MLKRPWNEAERNVLRERYASGVPLPEIAAELNRNVSSIRNQATDLGLRWHSKALSGFTVQPSPKMARSFEELLEANEDEFRRKSERAGYKKAVKVDIQGTGPYALVFFGDCHIGDPGCDIALLLHAMDTVRRTPRMYALNIGDLANQWIGKLGRLYAHQTTTDDEEIEMMRGMLKAIPWLAVILGNHDKWHHVASLLCDEAGVAHVSHGATFHISCEGQEEPLIVDARHDHRGRSMYNPAHGQLKRAYRGSDADIIIGGHIHQGAYNAVRNGVTGRLAHCIRLGAFKRHDEYVDASSFDQDDIGPIAVAVVDPNAPRDERVSVQHSLRRAKIELGALIREAS